MQDNEPAYKNQKDMLITSYQSGPREYESIDPLPVTAYYNDSYTTADGYQIEILQLDVADSGYPYIRYRINSDGGNAYSVFATYEKEYASEKKSPTSTKREIDQRCNLNKGTEIDIPLLGIGSGKPIKITVYISIE